MSDKNNGVVQVGEAIVPALIRVVQSADWIPVIAFKPLTPMTSHGPNEIYHSMARMLPQHPEEVARLREAGIEVEIEGKVLK